MKESAFPGLVASDGTVLVVDEGQFISLAGEVPAFADRPTTVADAPHIPDAIVHRGRAVRACYRKTCRTLGPRVSALFPPRASTPAAPAPDTLPGQGTGATGTVTANLELLVHNDASVYAIAKDARLPLAPPPGVSVATPILVEPYGNVLVAAWGSSGGIYTAKGIVGDAVPFGPRVELASNRLAVGAERVTIIDTRSGAQLGSVELSAAPANQRRAIKLGANRLAVAYEIGGAWTVAWVTLSPKGVPAIERRISIPVCP